MCLHSLMSILYIAVPEQRNQVYRGHLDYVHPHFKLVLSFIFSIKSNFKTQVTQIHVCRAMCCVCINISVDLNICNEVIMGKCHLYIEYLLFRKIREISIIIFFVFYFFLYLSLLGNFNLYYTALFIPFDSTIHILKSSVIEV